MTSSTPEQGNRPFKDTIYVPSIYGGLGAVLMATIFIVALALIDSDSCESKAGTKCIKAGHRLYMKRASLKNEVVEHERLVTTQTLAHQKSVLDLCLTLREAQAKLKKAIASEQSELRRNELLASLIAPKKAVLRQAASEKIPARIPIADATKNGPVSSVPVITHQQELDWPTVCQQAYEGELDTDLAEERLKALDARLRALNACSDSANSGTCATPANAHRAQGSLAKGSGK